MRLALPPLDAHAHVDTSIAPNMLRELRAVVVAVTREPCEWDAALARRDPSTLWAIGAHPGVAGALDDFDVDRFRKALDTAAFVGEVGLDARATTNRERQRQVFDAVLDSLVDEPRPVTIHSTAATGNVLAALGARTVTAPVLHWWRGERAQTTTALGIGCFFSINAHEVTRPRVLDLVPRERVLTETDFPHTRRYDRASTRPGSLDAVEAHLELRWNTDRLGVRRQVWRNFGSLLVETRVIDRMPRAILAALASAGFEG
jgi:TatD DNase family protein